MEQLNVAVVGVKHIWGLTEANVAHLTPREFGVLANRGNQVAEVNHINSGGVAGLRSPTLHACHAIVARVRGSVASCRVCGCTDADCRQCIAKTGEPCYWLEPGLCSACATPEDLARIRDSLIAEATPWLNVGQASLL